MTRPVYVHEYSIACALGGDAASVRHALLSPSPSRVHVKMSLKDGREVPAGVLPLDLPETGDTRCNGLADHCLSDLERAIAKHKSEVGAARMAVIIGTCTAGVQEAGVAFEQMHTKGAWPADYRFPGQELGDTARHVGARLGAKGPVYGISTACTSGAKAMASAARLIQAGICDVALAGGVDTLCDLTLNGFAALESVSETVCNPFSRNRRGINLGEGAALFLLSAVPSAIRLAGWGESADAYHISAPDPEGKGATTAMERALSRAGRSAGDIGYLNLHGTATKLNDLMESRAVAGVFGSDLPCSSTKPLTGHTLGAAGACEAAFTIMALETGRLPGHQWDGEVDLDMPLLRFVPPGGEKSDMRHAMSCSYAFGGNNIALVLEAA
jgi:3-oxoacyl-[acyl-carrier-protein] synthase-1